MSMAQPLPAQAVGMPLSGVPHGHPMAMGHPANPGGPAGGQAPGGVLGQQMHPSLSGPGGPQASQAGPMMANIPLGTGGPGPGGPGAGGPSAHALSHLNPGQVQQMYGQQQMAQAREWNFLFILLQFVLAAFLLPRSASSHCDRGVLGPFEKPANTSDSFDLSYRGHS